MTEYHKRTTAKKLASIAYWKTHPMKPEEYFAQFKRLLEQRLARESKSQDKGNGQYPMLFLIRSCKY